MTWVRDGARHSFGTYYGKLNGYREAAEMMGHSGGMGIFDSHYKGLCKKLETAETYFGIEPSRQGEVVPLKTEVA